MGEKLCERCTEARREYKRAWYVANRASAPAGGAKMAKRKKGPTSVIEVSQEKYDAVRALCRRYPDGDLLMEVLGLDGAVIVPVGA
jgi:hypothetical protein